MWWQHGALFALFTLQVIFLFDYNHIDHSTVWYCQCQSQRDSFEPTTFQIDKFVFGSGSLLVDLIEVSIKEDGIYNKL